MRKIAAFTLLFFVAMTGVANASTHYHFSNRYNYKAPRVRLSHSHHSANHWTVYTPRVRYYL